MTYLQSLYIKAFCRGVDCQVSGHSFTVSKQNRARCAAWCLASFFTTAADLYLIFISNMLLYILMRALILYTKFYWVADT